MKIIVKYILNNIKERKMRTAVMLLSIVLSTTLLFVSLSIGDSYAEAQRKMARGMAGSAAISVSLGTDADENQNWISRDAVSDNPAIGHVAGLVKTMALYKEDGYYENFDVLAFDLDDLAAINRPRLEDGDEITDFIGNQIILPDRFASKFGTKQGDGFTLWINEKPYEFTVAAIAPYDTVFLRHTRGTNALIPIDTLSSILGAGEGYSELLIEPSPNSEAASLCTELRAALPTDYKVNQIVNEGEVEASARQKSMPFFLISFFTLTMSVFIIFSSYKVITLERLPVIGTFRSIGATEQAVTKILMLESLIYGVLGAVCGIPAGVAVLRLLLNGLGTSLSSGIHIPMIISPVSIGASCFAAITVSLLSSWIPVKRASRLPVKEVVLGNVEHKAVSNIRLSIFGIILVVTSVILPYIGKYAGGFLLYLTGGLSLVTLLAAAIIIIPLLTSGISVLLEKVYGLLPGNVCRLAARNMRGNKNVAQNITLLFISISAVIAITVVGNFVKVYIGDVFRGAKLDGFTDAVMSTKTVDKIRSLEGIDEVLPIRVMNETITLNDTVVLSRVEGTDHISKYSEMFAMTYDNEKDREVTENSFGSGRNILLSYETMENYGLRTGDTVTLSYHGQSFEYIVMGSVKIRSTNTTAVIPSDYAVSDFGSVNYGIAAYTAPDPEAVMIQIRDLFGSENHWSRTVEEFNEDAIGTVSAFLQPMQNLTWFILILAAVGIINNLLINHIQKRREIAMYQSVGMSNRQNVLITLVEGFSSGLVGAVIAMVISWLEIKTIFMVAGPKIAMKPELDVKTFLFAGALGIGITLIGSIVPIIKTNHLNIVEELKFE